MSCSFGYINSTRDSKSSIRSDLGVDIVCLLIATEEVTGMADGAVLVSDLDVPDQPGDVA